MNVQGSPVPATATDRTTADGFRQTQEPSISMTSEGTASLKTKRSSPIPSLARRTLGIILLGLTVFCWTGSSFLASSIFANDTFSKPFFVCYINTSFFIVALIPFILKAAFTQGLDAVHPRHLKELWSRYRTEGHWYKHVSTDEDVDEQSSNSSNVDRINLPPSHTHPEPFDHEKLDLFETAKLSLEFCVLWFAANYFASACLKYTSVASTTIISSTSSVWTLILGAITKVETFTIKKALSVFASLAGIALISTVDMSGQTDQDRGSFPRKTSGQITLGDALALFGAIIYGVYTILMKKRIGDESRVNMPLFFGLVGLFNVITMWPGFLLLHFTGIETFEFPSTKRIWIVILWNSVVSLISDISWAYALLLTTPLLVTLGLSLTIPLSLIGQMILSSQYSSVTYWIGACIVFLSFVFINHESNDVKVEG